MLDVVEIPEAKIYADTLAEIRHRPPVGKQPIRDYLNISVSGHMTRHSRIHGI